MTDVPGWYAPPGEPVREDGRMKLWRLTLECGHLRISGPWDDDEPDDKHMIGDITVCEVCPKVNDSLGLRKVMALRQVVNVDSIPATAFRESEDKAARQRRDQLAG